jgi:hypothetical protein
MAKFPKMLEKAVEKENERTYECMEMIKGATVETLQEVSWRFTQWLTPFVKKAFNKELPTMEETRLSYYKKLALAKLDKENVKVIANIVEKFDELEASDLEYPTDIDITVEWVKSRTWGMNPHATVYITHICRYEHTGKASGCGYDKESAAIAEALNDSPIIQAMLVNHLEQGKVFPYGISNYRFPKFEGGVGTSCYYKVFEAMGYKMEQVANGKSFDAYIVRKA